MSFELFLWTEFGTKRTDWITCEELKIMIFSKPYEVDLALFFRKESPRTVDNADNCEGMILSFFIRRICLILDWRLCFMFFLRACCSLKSCASRPEFTNSDFWCMLIWSHLFFNWIQLNVRLILKGFATNLLLFVIFCFIIRKNIYLLCFDGFDESAKRCELFVQQGLACQQRHVHRRIRLLSLFVEFHAFLRNQDFEVFHEIQFDLGVFWKEREKVALHDVQVRVDRKEKQIVFDFDQKEHFFLHVEYLEQLGVFNYSFSAFLPLGNL